jgi:hypothetical protein
MSSNSGRINKKSKGKRKCNQKIVYRGGDAETNQSFIDKLQLEVDEYRRTGINGQGVTSAVLRERNGCNYDIIFSADLYQTSKNTYDVYLTQSMGDKKSPILKKLLAANPFIKLIAGGDENVSQISNIFKLVYDLKYLYLFYLCIYRDSGEEFLKTFLEDNDSWPIKPVNNNSDAIIKTIKEYNSNINQIKETGTIEGMSDDEQVAFTIVMVVVTIFFQTMREMGNISVRINKNDDIDVLERPSGLKLYSAEDYVSFGKCVVNITTAFSTSEYMGSTVDLFILFSCIPVSSILISKFLFVLANTNVYVNDASQQNDQPGMILPLNNFPGSLTNSEDIVFINELRDPKNANSPLTQKINNLFAPLPGQTVPQQDFTLVEYIKKGNYIDIVITNAEFYVKTTDVWLLLYVSKDDAKQTICGFVLITMIYDFIKKTYENENQIRWYTGENDSGTIPPGYYNVPTCIRPLAAANAQAAPGTGFGNKMPYILGALGTAGAVAAGLYFGKVFGGKTRRKSRKPRRAIRSRNALTMRKRKTGLRQVKK